MTTDQKVADPHVPEDRRITRRSKAPNSVSLQVITSQATRACNALWFTFLTMGIVSMAWVLWIPEIKEANGLTDAQFGLVLVASSVGAIFGAQLHWEAMPRFGS